MKKVTLIVVLAVVVVLLMPQSDSLNIPNSNIKTVEFFIGQQGNGPVAAKEKTSFGFSFNIPENLPEARYAWIEINGVSLGLTGDTQIRVSLDGKNINSFSLDGLLETQRFTIRYPFYPDIRQGNNGPYTLEIVCIFSTNSCGGLNAKLVLTYEYDSDSPLQVKTVKYFADQTNTSFATAAKALLNFSVFIPESNINVTSAFLEVIGVCNCNADQVLGATLINSTSRNKALRTVIDGTAATQAFVILYNASSLYDIKKAGTYNTFALEVNGTGTITSGWGATAILTYEHNSTDANQLKTVRYLVSSQNTSVSTGALVSNTFVFPVAENLTVQSAWIKYSAWTGAATSADPNVNVRINGVGRNHTFDFNLEGSNFVILYNATQIYSIDGNKTEGPYTFSARTTAATHTTSLGMAELFLTYNFSPTISTLRTKTVEYGYFNLKPTAGVGPSGADDVFFIIAPENNVTAQSVYLEVSSVGSSTLAHNINMTIDGIGTNYVQANTGETTYDYILFNLSNAAHNFSTGLNGQYVASYVDSGITSLTGGKVIATYFFR